MRVLIMGAGGQLGLDLLDVYADATVAEVELSSTTSEAFARPAPQPAWSVLEDRHAPRQGLSMLPHWRDGLERMLGELGVLEGDR